MRKPLRLILGDPVEAARDSEFLAVALVTAIHAGIAPGTLAADALTANPLTPMYAAIRLAAIVSAALDASDVADVEASLAAWGAEVAGR